MYCLEKNKLLQVSLPYNEQNTWKHINLRQKTTLSP
jgi:hypothetical protein